MNVIRSCLLQYSYSFKIENNCYSIYMNKTFYGHTPNVDGLLNLDHSDMLRLELALVFLEEERVMQQV